MKVLFFIDGLIAGGKERRLVELMKGIKSTFPAVQMELALMNSEIHYKQVFDLGITIHYLVRKTKKDVSIFRKFYKICKTFRPDVIHCWDSMTAIYSIPASRLLDVKLVNGMIADAPSRFSPFNKFWLRVKFGFLFSNVVIGNSMAGLKGYGAPARKSMCIYNGFDFERAKAPRDPAAVRKDFDVRAKFVVLMVGAFGDRKDYDSFIEAAKILCRRRNDVEFLAVGDGKNFARIAGTVGPEFSGSIKLLGKQTDVESIINTVDVCVLTTNSKIHGEGISNSILEYMALAKPVVATYGGGTNEIVEDGKTGFLVPAFDPPALVQKIETLLNDPDLCRRFGLEGRERVHEKFFIGNMVRRYISVYENASKKSASYYENRQNVLS